MVTYSWDKISEIFNPFYEWTCLPWLYVPSIGCHNKSFDDSPSFGHLSLIFARIMVKRFTGLYCWHSPSKIHWKSFSAFLCWFHQKRLSLFLLRADEYRLYCSYEQLHLDGFAEVRLSNVVKLMTGFPFSDFVKGYLSTRQDTWNRWPIL